MRATVVLVLCTSLASIEASAEPGRSPVAMDDHLRFGAAIVRSTGALPAALGGDRFDEFGGRLELAFGFLGDEQFTSLGSRAGVEGGLRLTAFRGQTDPESSPIGFDARVLMALKVWSFDVPFRGQLVLCLGPEVGVGGPAWWSDSGRFSPLAGARLMVGQDDASLELEYVLVPHVFTSAEADLVARHGEHRFLVSAGAGQVGIAASYTYGREVIRGVEGLASSAHQLAIAIEWRR